VTVIASLTSAKGKAQNAVSAARRHASEYLEIETDRARREEIFGKLLADEAQIKQLPAKYRARIRDEDRLIALLQRAHDEHSGSPAG
jgi:tellurite resistance protein TerC